MARIPDEILDCSVFLYPSKDDADAEEGSVAGGTGFLVGVSSDDVPELWYFYVVTNKHVVTGLKNDKGDYEGGSQVVRLNTWSGKSDSMDLSGSWVNHPTDDLAVAYAPVLHNVHKFTCIDFQKYIPDKQKMEVMKIGPGDDTYMVGRFINHHGKQRNLPSVRWGHISMMPP